MTHPNFRNMKTYLFALLLSTFCFNSGYSNEAINMKEVLEESLRFKNEGLNLEKNKTLFVKVSFRINELGTIEVLNANYSNKTLKEQLVEKLESLHFDGIVDVEKIYYYNFTFIKK